MEQASPRDDRAAPSKWQDRALCALLIATAPFVAIAAIVLVVWLMRIMPWWDSVLLGWLLLAAFVFWVISREDDMPGMW